MASKTIVVEAYDGDRLVARLSGRPVRLMPDGYARVVYNGLVYPLYVGDFIQLIDTPVTKEECGRFVAAYSNIPYALHRVVASPAISSEAGKPDVSVADNDIDALGADVDEMVGLLIAKSAKAMGVPEAFGFLELFDLNGSRVRQGYFSGRYREALARAGAGFDDSAEVRIQLIAELIRDDRELLGRLISAHGPFLAERSTLARRALAAEFDKIDLDATWRSSDDALRRARASSIFVRRASLLLFGNEECRDQLGDMVTALAPTAARPQRQHPDHVVAAVSHLERMIAFVEGLLSGDDALFTERFVNGRSELQALAEGNFDHIAGIARWAMGASQPADGDLGFVVLPPGELIQSFIAELRAAGRYKGREIDLRQTDVLSRLQSHFTDSECRIHRGAFQSSGEDNLYVVLAIARPGAHVEDAVAISPCKGEHATFVVRHDCGDRLPWRDVLSRTKHEAKQVGARRLRFTSKSGRGIDEYDAMLEKLVWLLKCESDEFDSASGYLDYGNRSYSVAGRTGPPRQPPAQGVRREQSLNRL